MIDHSDVEHARLVDHYDDHDNPTGKTAMIAHTFGCGCCSHFEEVASKSEALAILNNIRSRLLKTLADVEVQIEQVHQVTWDKE